MKHMQRFNILTDRLKEHDSNVWETKERTDNIVHEFFQNALPIENSKTIKFADVHCLLQQPGLKKCKESLTINNY